MYPGARTIFLFPRLTRKTGTGIEAPAPFLRLKLKLLALGSSIYTCDSPNARPLLAADYDQPAAALYDLSRYASNDPFLRLIATTDVLRLERARLGTPYGGANWEDDICTMYLHDASGQGARPRTFLRAHVVRQYTAPLAGPPVTAASVGGGGSGSSSSSSRLGLLDEPPMPWLMLYRSRKDAPSPNGNDVAVAYRVRTVGGEAPSSCRKLGETVEVRYAAQYWLYDNTDHVSFRGMAIPKSYCQSKKRF